MKELQANYDYLQYVTELKLLKKKHLVLSSKHHFYFDLNELKKTKTLIHLKKLNYTKELNNLIKSIQTLSKNTIFCGCFDDNKTFTNFFKSLSNSKIKLLSKKDVYFIFTSHDFKINNEKDINGVTYFCAKK